MAAANNLLVCNRRWTMHSLHWLLVSAVILPSGATPCRSCTPCLSFPSVQHPWLQVGLPMAPGQALAFRRGPCRARCRPVLSQEVGRPSAARLAVDPWGLQGVAPWAQARQEQAPADHLQVPRSSCIDCMAARLSASRLRCPSFQQAIHRGRCQVACTAAGQQAGVVPLLRQCAAASWSSLRLAAPEWWGLMLWARQPSLHRCAPAS